MESGEIQCSQCSGDFLELIGQNLDTFLVPRNRNEDRPHTTSTTTSTPQAAEGDDDIPPPPLGNLILPQLISQFLGNSPLTSTNGRPVGFVIRQALPGDDLLTALLGRSIVPPGGSGGNSFEDLLHHLMMNESSYARHGATEEVISKLERRTENLHELGECSISQEPFTENDVAVILPCHHAFKENEILQWLHVNNSCPVCRVSVE